MSTLYASFLDATAAEHAAAALLDHGARSEDLSIIANEQFRNRVTFDSASAEAAAKTGITTTTAADAGVGAAKGSLAGLGVGILGAMAALFIPGVGIVLGGGALAAAVGAAAAATAAGAAAGGVAGFLKDQGIGDEMALNYSRAIDEGGALLAINIPSGDLTATEIEPYLLKYGALHVETYNHPRNFMAGHDDAGVSVLPAEQVVFTNPVPAVELEAPYPPNSLTTMATVPSSTPAAAAALNSADVRPTLIDPVTGAMREGVVIDPLTGVERPVKSVNGAIVYADVAPAAPVYAQPVVAAPAAVEPAMAPASGGFTLADVTPVEIDPVSGVVTRGTVTDPVSGRVRAVRVVNGSIVYADVI
ncbi:hypothetical protein [Fimbriimonas ginsengisoli]|uniref:Uncharacterized protein n=1 Tax=Fimbriimonas ginsengisoli Gsoil 348 TaxID=661478 RepID=A0A068NX79_FIMGI|nr:hypothetical protein [Fimbriimonas ginsengisoli]AIE87957.1 hypothetical protein OP10G_4589 [Fimbriimonas ginsengisoli Gsoil 348]